MMTRVRPNVLLLLFRLILLLVFVYLFRGSPVLEKFNSMQYTDHAFILVVSIIAISLFPLYLLWTLLGVFWVTIEDMSTIRFQYFYKNTEVKASDIQEYYTTIVRTKASRYNGLLIKLKSSRVIELTEFNLTSVQEIEEFLTNNNIPYKGDTKSWFPLTKKV